MTTRPARRPILAAAAFAIAVLAGACSDGSGGGQAATTVPTVSGPAVRVLVPESSATATVARVYARYLEAQGYPVAVIPLAAPAGSTADALDAIERGDADLVVDDISRFAAALVPDARLTAEPDQVITVIKPALAAVGATALGYSPAADGEAFVVRADSPAIRISNVKNLDYVLGAPADCERRPKCYVGLTDPDVYGIEFKGFETIERGPEMGDALAAKRVDAVIWTAAAPEIKERGFKILEDDKRLFPAQNLAPVVATSVQEAYGSRLRADLDTLSDTITTDDLVAWNVETELRGRPPVEVAADWLKKKGLA